MRNLSWRAMAAMIAATLLLTHPLTVNGEADPDMAGEAMTVEYQQEGVVLEGYVVKPANADGPRPGVLIVHQWKGVSDHEKQRAHMLAELGYVAFVVDIYGKGVRPQTSQEAGREATKYRQDVDLFRKRLHAGLKALREVEGVDTERIAAIGYCFGGGGVLELARSGADVRAVVSFHGSLTTPRPEDANLIRAKVLVCHGAIDPLVPHEDVIAFWNEMDAASVDYQFIAYAGAVHSFTHRDVPYVPGASSGYNREADLRSWEHMKLLFNEVF